VPPADVPVNGAYWTLVPRASTDSRGRGTHSDTHHMDPDQRQPKYQGPEEFDINRSESDAPERRWIGRGAKILVAIGALLILLSMFGRPLLDLFRQPGQGAASLIERTPATVTNVVDGITITVEIDGHTASVRYLGLRPPGSGTELYDLAAAVNHSWVQGTEVLLERDVTDTDLEGRLLRYVWLEDAMINAALLAYGLARHAPSPADTRYSADFDRIEAEARLRGLGMWQPETGDAAGASAGTGPRTAVAARLPGPR